MTTRRTGNPDAINAHCGGSPDRLTSRRNENGRWHRRPAAGIPVVLLTPVVDDHDIAQSKASRVRQPDSLAGRRPVSRFLSGEGQ